MATHSLEKGIAPHSSILAWKSMDRGAWRATVPGVAESDMTLQQQSKMVALGFELFCPVPKSTFYYKIWFSLKI